MLQSEFEINGYKIGNGLNPYIIAEVGSNFNQSLETAKRLIGVAADAGVDAVKFQLFRADALYPQGGKMFDIFRSIELNPGWVPELMEQAREREIEFLASAFDRKSVDVLEDAGVNAYKVASSETANLPLLHYMAAKSKPMILATGMCDMVDVEEAVAICEAAGNTSVALLQCGSMYPLPAEQTHLLVMRGFAGRFGCPVGFSDHTLSNSAAIASVGLGVAIIEKHFTLDKTAEGPDHFYALEPHELKALVAGIREAHQAMGSNNKVMLAHEREVGRREGLYAVRDIAAGSVVTEDDIEIRRPAVGLRARYKPIIIGAKCVADIAKDESLTWSSLAL